MRSDCRNPSERTGPLAGFLAVSLEQAVAAPYCTARLADAGARVIKIERPEGDFARDYDSLVQGQSAYFVWLNRGKESLVLDIKCAEDLKFLHRLIARADVFIQNLAPGAAARAGLGSQGLHAANPRLIACDISGYGGYGPYQNTKAYDLLIQCETALASITGSAAEPGRVGVSVADICCGMNAYSGILEALIEREMTDRGRCISVSLFDGIAEWMAVPLLHHEYGAKPTERVGLNHPSIAPYGLYTTSDRTSLIIAVQNEREWIRFCSGVLLDPSLAGDSRFVSNARRCEHRAQLDGLISSCLGQLDRQAVIDRLRRADIAHGVLNDLAGLSRHPQLRRRTVDTAGGPVRLPASPLMQSAVEDTPVSVPALGADSERIRREFAE